MKKRIFAVVMVLVAVFLIAACNMANGQGSSQETPQSVEKGKYPMTIVDQAGREVVLEKKPESLVSSYYITTSVMLALGLDEEIKGIESNPEKRPLYQKCAPKLLTLTQVGSPKEFDLEVCASIQPDLVVLPMRAKDMVEPLEKLGILVLIVNPESQDEIIEMIQLIGKATDREERANQLTGFIQDKVQFLKEKLEGCDRPTVYLGGNSDFLSTASGGMYQNDLISLAGGKNVAGDIDDTYWVESSYEQILAWNPEVIVMASEAKYSMEEVQTNPGLKDCQALINQQIIKIPSDAEAWDSPVPSSILGAVYLANMLHPNLVTDKEYEDTVEDYYETFYGFSYAQSKDM